MKKISNKSPSAVMRYVSAQRDLIDVRDRWLEAVKELAFRTEEVERNVNGGASKTLYLLPQSAQRGGVLLLKEMNDEFEKLDARVEHMAIAAAARRSKKLWIPAVVTAEQNLQIATYESKSIKEFKSALQLENYLRKNSCELEILDGRYFLARPPVFNNRLRSDNHLLHPSFVSLNHCDWAVCFVSVHESDFKVNRIRKHPKMDLNRAVLNHPNTNTAIFAKFNDSIVYRISDA